MIALLTDSTCDLPENVLTKFAISVLPMTIKVNGATYLDRINLSSDAFYAQITNSDSRPETEPPSVEDFIRRYGELLMTHDEILSIHVGSTFSQTVHHASQAAQQGRNHFFAQRLKAKNYKPFKIRVIDSKNVSVGVGLLVYRAAMMLEKTQDIDILAENLEELADKIRLIFTPRDLTYLHRSKRLTGIRYLIASVIGLKPLLQVANGKIDKFSTTRGFDKAVDAIVKELYGSRDNPLESPVAVAYAGMEADLGNNALARKLSNGLASSPGYFESIIGPTIGAHCGPETVGVAFFTV